MAGYPSMLSMMAGGGSSAPIPTQTFNSANFVGTPVPVVGDNKGIPPYAASVGGTDPKHIVVVAIILFSVGYLLYHFNFEK